ncbi:MAG: hypothetical protein H0W02_10265 [Ktedonobacteraceae bacterium]|nr:hypothetical protein [Ktedonobacteraceae bacterium]
MLAPLKERTAPAERADLLSRLVTLGRRVTLYYAFHRYTMSVDLANVCLSIAFVDRDPPADRETLLLLLQRTVEAVVGDQAATIPYIADALIDARRALACDEEQVAEALQRGAEHGLVVTLHLDGPTGAPTWYVERDGEGLVDIALSSADLLAKVKGLLAETAQ